MLKPPCFALLLILLVVNGCSLRPQPAPPPEPLSARWARAEEAISERRYRDAITILEDAALVYPDDVDVLIRIGKIYLTQHRWILAEDAFNRAIARDPAEARATAGLAETVLNQGRLPEALKFWQQAARLEPQLVGVFTGLGRTYLSLFDFEQAEAAFLSQQAHAPDLEAAWLLAALTAPVDREQALAYLASIPAADPVAETNDLADSIRSRRDYLAATLATVGPQSPQLEVARATGIALAQVGLWPLAVHALEIAVGQAPEDGEALAFLAHALAQSGRPALDRFEQARKANPESALPSYLEGVYLRQKGAFRAAEVLFGQAIQLDPENAALYAELGKIKDHEGNLAAAEAWYTAAAERDQETLEFQLLLLRFYANRNYRTAEAGIPLAERLIEANDDHAVLHDLLGWMQFLAGSPDGGEEALRRAVALDPNLISARYHLARYLETNGRPLDAVDEYQRVVDWETTEEFRDQAIKDLRRLEAQ